MKDDDDDDDDGYFALNNCCGLEETKCVCMVTQVHAV